MSDSDEAFWSLGYERGYIEMKELENSSDQKRRLILCMQDKGGCGRSTCASLIVDWLRQRGGMRLAVFDADVCRSTLTEIYGANGSAPLRAPDLFASVDWSDPQMGLCNIDVVVRCLGVDQPPTAEVAVLDASANSTSLLLRWLRDTKVFSIAEHFGIVVTVAIPVDGTARAAQDAADLLCALDRRADVLIMRNAKGVKHIPWDECFRDGRHAHANWQEIEIPAFGEQLGSFLEMQAYRGGRLSLLGATQCPDREARIHAPECWAAVERSFAGVTRILVPDLSIIPRQASGKLSSTVVEVESKA